MYSCKNLEPIFTVQILLTRHQGKEITAEGEQKVADMERFHSSENVPVVVTISCATAVMPPLIVFQCGDASAIARAYGAGGH